MVHTLRMAGHPQTTLSANVYRKILVPASHSIALASQFSLQSRHKHLHEAIMILFSISY